MSIHPFAHRLLSLLVTVSLLLTPATPLAYAQDGGPVYLPLISAPGVPVSDLLYRTWVQVDTPARGQRSGYAGGGGLVVLPGNGGGCGV